MEKFEKGKVFEPCELVNYVDGGVVSKELIHNTSGSDAGQGLSEHFAPFDALIQVIDGEMELTVEGVRNVIKAGEAFIIPSGARHSVNAAQRFKMVITMIKEKETDKVKFTNQ